MNSQLGQISLSLMDYVTLSFILMLVSYLHIITMFLYELIKVSLDDILVRSSADIVKSKQCVAILANP